MNVNFNWQVAGNNQEILLTEDIHLISKIGPDYKKGLIENI